MQNPTEMRSGDQMKSLEQKMLRTKILYREICVYRALLAASVEMTGYDAAVVEKELRSRRVFLERHL